MVPASHAIDLKASNSKTSATPAQPAHKGFQALLDRLGHGPSHAEERALKASAEKPKLEAAHADRKPEKASAPKSAKAEKLERTAAEIAADKADKHEDTNALALAAFLPKPEAAKDDSRVQNLGVAAPVKSVRDREKPLAGNDAPVPGLKPVPAFKLAEHASGVEDKPKVTVVDRRTENKEKDKEKAKVEAAATQVQPGTPLPAPEVAAKSDAVTGVAEAKVVFHPTDQGTPFDIKPQNAVPAARDAATFQQFLVDKGYGQLVDQARIVLRDNNAGEIRMTLHPESLGKVKVALNLSDGSLAGQIFVENQTVKDVFQSNMDGLLQAFRDGGWTNLSLQVSVGGEQKRNSESAPAPARDYGRQVAVSTEPAETVRIGAWTDRQINLTA